MKERRSDCPDCKGELRPIQLIDATHPGWGSAGAAQIELRYAGVDTPRSSFMGAIKALGIVRGAICPECGRILLHGEPCE